MTLCPALWLNEQRRPDRDPLSLSHRLFSTNREKLWVAGILRVPANSGDQVPALACEAKSPILIEGTSCLTFFREKVQLLRFPLRELCL